MRSTFSGLEITKRSLFTQQAALSTTAHNIANANTPGYSRQRVDMTATRPMEAVGLMRSTTPGQTGTGVEVNAINRIRDKFIDTQFYNENKHLGAWSARSETLDKLQAIVNEPSDTGIRQVVQNFWNAWQELSKAPDNLTARKIVKESAIALTDTFNATSKQLNDLSISITDNIHVKVNDVNSTISAIAKLNQEIYRVEGLGDNANDLRDQRDLLMDNLSSVINVTYTEEDRGYTVRMGSVELVNGFAATTAVTDASLAANVQSGDLNSGEIYGLFVSRDQYVADYQNQLDTMVKAFVQGDIQVTLPQGTVVPEGKVLNGVTYTGSISARTLAQDTVVTVAGINGLHQLGYVLSDTGVQTGGDLFTLKPGTTGLNAANVTVNPDIMNHVENIAASLRTYMDTVSGTEKVVNGNNALALLIAGMNNTKFNFDPDGTGTAALNGGTLDEFLRSVVGSMGVQAQEANRQMANQQTLVDQVDNRRQSISGVSLDEEMANMIKFQHAYNAAARALTTFDSALDKLINGTGLVGR